MIQFKDNFGIERGIDFNLSFCGKFVNLTLYAPSKGSFGSALQLPKAAFSELVGQVIKLQQEINDVK